MSFFTSARERRLWLLTLAAVVGIYSTLGLASTLAGALLERGILDDAFLLGMFLVAGAVVLLGVKTRPSEGEIGVALGIAAVYLLVFLRIASPAERSHLIEYSVLSIFIYQALAERARNGSKVPLPGVLAWVATVLLGWLDEGIQAILPSRVYDIRDVGFNALAALLAIVACLALEWARRRSDKGRS